MIAAGKIGTPDRAGKEHIADNSQTFARVKKHHMPRRVPRTMDNPQCLLAKLDRVAIFQPAIGHERLCRRQSVLTGGFGQAIDPETILLVRTFYRYAKALRQNRSAGTVIDMPMGQKNLDRNQGTRRDLSDDPLKIAAGIDYGSLARAFAAQN